MHFVSKDFTIDKPSDSIDTSTEAVGESEQFVSKITTRHTTGLVLLPQSPTFRPGTLLLLGV